MKEPETQQQEGSWKQFKGRIKEAWGTLTDDEIDRFKGQRDQLEGHIEKKTGEEREAIRNKIDRAATDTRYKV